MPVSLIDPRDSLERKNQKLETIVQSLMRRVEQETDDSGQAYAHFERAVVLERQVQTRTRDLEKALDLLNRSNADLDAARLEAETARADLYNALEAIREGFALFDSQDRLSLFNSRFCQRLPDVADALRPGMSFDQYVGAVSQSRHLKLAQGETAEGWALMRRDMHHKLHVGFNIRVQGDRWLQVSEQRTPNNGTIILQTDVTAMIRLERQERDRLLDDQARLIRATLDHVDQGIAIFDADCRIAGMNKRLRQMLDLGPLNLPVGTRFAAIADLLIDHRRFADVAPLHRLLEWTTNRYDVSEIRQEFLTLSGVNLDLFARTMPDGGFVVSFTDVTAERRAALELTRANEELEVRVNQRTTALRDALDQARRANASKSRFVAAASHDLLQPVNAAKLFLSSLKTMETNDDQNSMIGRIDNAFDDVERILGALLDMSKLDSGLADIDTKPFAIASIMRPLEEQSQAVARQKGLDLRFVHSDAWVISDMSYLRRILQNLVANALHYTQSGKILVGCRKLDGCIRIEVHDTGPGIPSEQQARIFREFQRFNQPDNARHGMGLGLAIVERACRLLGHDLNLDSVVGKGSRFAVTVQTTLPQNTNVAIPASQQAEPAALSDLLVLVIENDEIVRQATATLLENWGMQVIDVESGDDARMVLEEVELVPDIILADFQLDHGLDGIEAIDTLRQHFGRIPAIIVSANRSPVTIARCRDAGCLYQSKPLQPDRLRSAITDLAATIEI